MALLLQFTDLHLRDDPAAVVRGVVPQRCFDETLYHAHRHHWPADAVLLTGDLANDEFDNSYSRLAAIAARWRVPVLAVPGNHDHGEKLRASFEAVPLAKRNILDIDDWRLVALDSQVPRAVHGALDESMYALLEEAAATRGGRELIVALHHPPLALGSRWLDGIGLRDAERFRATLARIGARACLFGHAHQEWDSTEAGVRYLGTPSTSRQFLPRADHFAESDQPPAYRWLALASGGAFDTGVEWLPPSRD